MSDNLGIRMTVSNVKTINKGSLVAFFDLEFTGMKLTICGCMYMKKGENEWVSFPTRPYQGQDGQTKYAWILKWENKELSDRFSAAVVPLVKAMLPKSEERAQQTHSNSKPAQSRRNMESAPMDDDEIPFD